MAKEAGHGLKSTGQTFEQSIIACRPAVYAYLMVLTHNRDIAEEIAQETIVRAWFGRASFEPGTNLKAWLCTIALNFYRSEYRKAKTRARYAMRSAPVTGIACVSSAESNLELDAALKCMGTLPSEQREALMLVCGDTSYDEAALIGGCAVGTIKSRVSRARKKLRRMTGKEA